jgi:hypothetical protein
MVKKNGYGTSNSNVPETRALNVEVKRMAAMQSTNFYSAFRTGNFILSVVSFGLIGLGVDLGTDIQTRPQNNPSIKKISDKKYTFDVDYQLQKNKIFYPYFTKSFKLFQFKGLFFYLRNNLLK